VPIDQALNITSKIVDKLLSLAKGRPKYRRVPLLAVSWLVTVCNRRGILLADRVMRDERGQTLVEKQCRSPRENRSD
jgi:hypothetical protein